VVIGLALAAGVCDGTFPAAAACSNPSPLPSGYAAPCPVFSVSPVSVSQTGTLTLSATPQPGTDYIYTTAYYAKGSTWLPITLSGNNAAPSYSSGPATGSMPASIFSTLTPGTNYVVLWDWLWDATAQCYKGPGLNQCNTGTWRLQTFGLTAGSSSCLTSSTTFQNQAITPQTGSFRITFDATPAMNLMDGDMGLSANAAAAYTDLAVSVNFSNTGNIIARNGAAAQALSPIPYTSGVTYHFRLDINIPNHTYSAYVTSPEQTEKAIGLNYTFRTEQAGVTSLSDLNLVDTSGSETVCSSLVSLSTSPTPTPTLSPTPTPSPSGCTSGCNNYYVSPMGSDSNPGTQASPWKTLAHADSAATLGTNGTVIHVADGTYNGDLYLSKAGTSDSVRFRWQCDNQSNASKNWPCKIVGNGVPPRGTDNMVELAAAYTDFVGFDLSSISTNDSYGLNLTSSFQSAMNNRVHDLPNICTDNGGGGINPGPGGNGTLAPATMHDDVITGNWIFNIDVAAGGWGNHCHGMYVSATNVIIENNVIFNNTQGYGIGYKPHVAGWAVISNNTLWGNGGSNYCPTGPTPCTTPSSAGGCMIFSASYYNPINMTVDNNICYNNPGTYQGMTFYPGDSVGTGSVLRNNLMYGNGDNAISGLASGTITSPPNFANFQANGSGDYHPTASGVLTNGGSTACASGGASPCTPSTDITGKTRPNPPSIGAYEQ
jgi:hypothetical protein